MNENFSSRKPWDYESGNKNCFSNCTHMMSGRYTEAHYLNVTLQKIRRNVI